MIGQRDWYSRLLAIVYAWTIGLVAGIIIVPLALLYALAGSGLKVMGVGRQSDIPLWKPLKSTFQWWFSIHDHAISGTSTYTLLPPVFD